MGIHSPHDDPAADAGTAPIRAAVIDSRPLVASGLAQLLRRWGGFHVVLVHSTQVGMLEELSRAAADVVLIGVDDGEGPEALSMLQEAIASTDAHVVALVSSSRVEVIAQILGAGADSVVFSRSDYHELAAAMVALHAAPPSGRSTPELTDLVNQLIVRDPRPQPRRTQLSPREFEVLRAVVVGKPTRQIAQELGLSQNTVRTHVQKLLRKLDAHSRLEAAAIATEQGLLN